MAEGSSGLREIEAETGSPTEEPSSPTGRTFNESNPKPVENTKSANGAPKPLKDSRLPAPAFSHLPGFTHFISQRNPSYPDKIFASALFASGHGCALYSLGTVVDHLPDDYRNIRGIDIGDVGILSESNQFLFEFNIFLPADHPYNKNHTPRSFIPLAPLNGSEISTTVNYFPRGSVIASKGVKVTRHSEDPLHITFSSSERRGAFMVLAKGATRHEISTTTTRVLDYIKENAINWVRHFGNIYSAANGSPYIVTGVDKTSECANLVFPPRDMMPARYQNGTFQPMNSMSDPMGQSPDETLSPMPNNLSVFMRGIRIGLGRTKWVENVDGRPEADTLYTEIFLDTARLPFFTNRIGGKNEPTIPLNDKSFFAVHAFHPSDIVAQIMLCLDLDDATAALVNDSVWSIASQAISDRMPEVRKDPLTFSCLRGCSFDDFCSILDDVFELHQLNKSKGVLELVRNAKQGVTKDPWHRRFWLWLTNRQMVRGGTAFKELFRQGQFHFSTNDDVRSRSRL